MAEKPKNNEIEVTPEMIKAGAEVLNQWFNDNWPEITPQADYGLIEKILRSSVLHRNQENFSA